MPVSVAKRNTATLIAVMDMLSGSDIEEVATRHRVQPRTILEYCHRYGYPVCRRARCGRKTKFVRRHEPMFADLVTILERTTELPEDHEDLLVTVSRVDIRRLRMLVTSLEFRLTVMEGLPHD